jgi:hypothetical protein
VVAVVLAGCGSADSTNLAQVQGTPVVHLPTATPEPKPLSQPRVGNTITVDSVATTRVSATPLTPDQYDSMKQGDIYVVCTVKMVIHGSSDADYNEFDFMLVSGTGNATDTTFSAAYTANNQLQSGTLTAGGSDTGDLIYEVAQGDHGAKLSWQPSFFGQTGGHTWLLGL